MIFAIFLVAALLVLGGVVGLVSALNLIPTDLGLVHFQAGTIALVAGMVTMAIGFSTRALLAALRRVATPHALAATLDERPRMPEPAIEPPLHSGREPAIAAGMLAAGAAAGAAFAAPSAPEPALEPLPPASNDIPADPEPAFELPPVALPETLDLGAEAATPEDGAVAPLPQAQPVDMPLPVDIPLAELLPAEPVAEPVAEPEPPPAPPVLPELAPIPAPPDLMLQAIPEPPVLSIEQEIRAQLGRASTPEPEPAPMAPPPAEPEVATVPGLIADADLAALDEGRPPLAPLETLEVVGAYDSGGTRFTMYSDGSVVAAGPEGETRYPTLQDLRRHLDQLAG
ncbi:MAG: hypothetical protein O9322_03995 [Beijerinckiaceae bacterium]|nr:hypothetical protein [Beijerinckiaceae bacterium]MCZ8298680.1 hypothetical protein [Beijerinckiaceae bacterium]